MRFESGLPARNGWKGNAFHSSGSGSMPRMVAQTIVALASVDGRAENGEDRAIGEDPTQVLVVSATLRVLCVSAVSCMSFSGR